MPFIIKEVSEITAQINQEIKDKNLTSKDPEYFRLKMREYYNNKLKLKQECPTCGKMLALSTFQSKKHKCKNTNIHLNV